MARARPISGFRAYFRWVADDHDAFRFLFGSGTRRDDEFNAAVTRITAEAAQAVAPLIAVDIDERHRTTIAHSLVGMAEGASRLLVERGDEFDPDEIAQVVADLAWAGLRAVQPKELTVCVAVPVGRPTGTATQTWSDTASLSLTGWATVRQGGPMTDIAAHRRSSENPYLAGNFAPVDRGGDGVRSAGHGNDSR